MKHVTYAIGDIHGEAERLTRLHEHIFKTHERDYGSTSFTLIHLGDYIDRGPDSCQVIDQLRQLERRSACTLINLRGNHEQMMLDGLRDEDDREMWLSNGGDATMQSYADAGYDDIPDAHKAWLKTLPSIHIDEVSKTIFVHAGIDVRIWPEQCEEVQLWTRSRRFFDTRNWKNSNLQGWRIIHGHTPTSDFYPELDGTPPQRINLDTGAVFGGRLTAVKLASGEDMKFLYA